MLGSISIGIVGGVSERRITVADIRVWCSISNTYGGYLPLVQTGTIRDMYKVRRAKHYTYHGNM